MITVARYAIGALMAAPARSSPSERPRRRSPEDPDYRPQLRSSSAWLGPEGASIPTRRAYGGRKQAGRDNRRAERQALSSGCRPSDGVATPWSRRIRNRLARHPRSPK